MQESLSPYLSRSRCQAIATNAVLPEQTLGVALFADISGFTPLTESLQTSLGPRRGAEALTASINQVFEALISHVYTWGGDVMGFAGDAMLVFFDAAETATHSQIVITQALHCAQAMQAAMADFSAMSTPDGKTHALKMKIGLAYGPLHRLLVGRPEDGLFDLLTGATLVRMAAAEHATEKGEIIAAAEIRQALGSQAEWGPERSAYFPLHRLAALDSPPPAAAALPDLPPEGLRPYFPPDVYNHLASAAGFAAELRPVVSAFLKFDGIDFEADPQAGQKLDAYVQMVQRLARRYGGNLIRLDYGDKGSVMHVVFGAPQTHEDDEARAVGWALAVQAEASQLPFISAQYLGMGCGQVYAGVLGARIRRGYTLMGDEINGSARLMQACQPGQILVSQPILAAAQKRFLFHQFPGFMVKGKFEPIPVAMPVAPMPVMPPMPAAPMHGRELELSHIEQRLQALQAGSGGVLRIQGGAGTGKSRLAAEVMQRAMQRGVRSLAGSGQSTGQSTPYLAWRDLIAGLFGLQSTWPAMQQALQIQQMLQWINPAWLGRVPLLGDLLGLEFSDTPQTTGMDPKLRQQSLFSLVGDLLARMAAQQPQLILIEDCHWLDQASAALIEALGLSLAEARLLLVITQRPALDPDARILPGLERLSGFTSLDLAELDESAVRSLIAARLGGELPDKLMALMLERAQGNPFYIEELVAMIRETGQLRQMGNRWVLDQVGDELRLPDSVQKTILARMDQLAEPERLTLRVASVAGRSFPFNLLQNLHPVRPAAELLDAQVQGLEKRQFVQPEQLAPEKVERFKHNLTHEVAYETLLYAQRRELHRTAAAWFEATYPDALAPYYPALVFHYQHAEIPERERHYARLAGLQAAARYANVEAINYLTRALALTPDEQPAQRFELLFGREAVYDVMGQREAQAQDIQALESLSAAISRQGQPHAALQVMLRRVNWHFRVGKYAEAEHGARLALETARQINAGDLKARALHAWGSILSQIGRHSEARAHFEQALTLAEGLADERLQADVLFAAGITDYNQEHYERALDCFQQVQGLYQRINFRQGEVKCENMVASVLMEQGRYGEAQIHVRQGLALSREIGWLFMEGYAWFMSGNLSAYLGDYAACRQANLHALEIWRATAARNYEGMSQDALGMVYLWEGDFAQAEAHVRQALVIHQETEDSTSQAYDHNHLGLILLAAGQPAAAQGEHTTAARLRRETGQTASALEDLAGLARAALAQGDAALAAGYAQEILSGLDECSPQGFEFPVWVYLTCYHALLSVDPSAARQALAEGHALLQSMAENIQEQALRQSFLENVPWNRELLQVYSRIDQT